MASVKTLDDLFLHTLQDIYYAEKQIVKALPKMAKKAASSELKGAFEKHLEETKGQVERLDQVFEALGKKSKAVKCQAIEGIIEEAQELMEEVEDEQTLDAAMLAAAQAVEHYEISRYGTLISWAKTLGHGEVVSLLEETLEQEKATDSALSKLGESAVNKKAA
ncbi:YciE/YciF ferroxidase family protein [Mangrovibrevibacter kandeliae]|uniref:YciE/YciF ferroxidase family protein n=1 Tax=Mangrovibrevibacter kandeliae TaxID=2968473 RepID=UPI002117428D|nr:ferritin-like domain-containing protein [Aurantimonas sp. CSK15Z-1]MCQ8782871.1 ferritin-like domain-containing protein [Aurantimonas sp. CSK15Z-1]